MVKLVLDELQERGRLSPPDDETRKKPRRLPAPSDRDTSLLSLPDDDLDEPRLPPSDDDE